jgi:hypothetical protein
MAIETTSTGGRLTKRVLRTAHDLDAIGEILERSKQSVPIKELIVYWGELCRTALKEAGIEGEGHTIQQAVQDRKYEHPAREWYQAEIFHDAEMIGIVQNRDVSTALGLALILGMKIKEYQLCGYDKPLETGLAVTENLSERRDEAHRRSKEKASRWQAVAIRLAERVWKQRPNLSASAVAGIILCDVQAAVKKKDTPPARGTIRRGIASSKPQKVGKGR